MTYKKMKQLLFTSFVLSALLISTNSHAQKYKTMADTTKLNKEYGEISLEISKLNTRLLEEKNKTDNFHSKSTSTAEYATTSGQASKDQADVATSGNTSDTKKAVKDAKEADKRANNSKDAMADEKKNTKKINELNAQIEKKQRILRDLDSQRRAIMGH